MNIPSQHHGQETNPSLGQKEGSAGLEGTTGFRGRYNKEENSAASIDGNALEKWLSLLATENGQQGS